MIVLHAPEQSSADSTIEAFKGLVLSVGKKKLKNLFDMTSTDKHDIYRFFNLW